MPAYTARENRFTVYDVMERKGVFRDNPANAESPLYGEVGPVEYPKMMYHPEGAERVVEPAHQEQTNLGIITIPARTEMISRVVKDQKEEEVLASEGWHAHPADAVEASGKPRPATSAANLIADLEAKIRKLEAEKARATR